ncbi:MAG TPA: DoxX family protein [Acidimicrobiales bacterium]|nr:DoxX family protein [Acidimicrobiales bacterium]
MSGRSLLRLTVGGLMLGHGLQKLQGSFGGPGLAGTEKFMESLDLHPAKHQAKAVALSETVGGALTAAGMFTPLGPAMIIGGQAVAIQKVHAKNGVWVTQGGFEYNATLIAAAFAIAADGPGKLSIDALFGKQRKGFGWGLASVVLGLGAAAATLAISEQFKPPAAPDTAQTVMQGPDATAEAPAGVPPAAAKN